MDKYEWKDEYYEHSSKVEICDMRVQNDRIHCNRNDISRRVQRFDSHKETGEGWKKHKK